MSPDSDRPAAEPAAAAADPETVATAPEGKAAQLGARPASDPLALAVARARISNKLFAKTEQVQLGRYHLLEMVGSGGMGVVWGAWDPELERRVAIKLVKATAAAARERIQLEGQALAKLSHPNVVTVYDVGVVDDQVYIVMEWVRGQNLRAYCRAPRSLREILAIYRAAGEGLAAAHAEGLIHRDFKPDNAILGDDGRVRVLDFGLARNELPATPGGPSPASGSSGSLPRVTASEATRGAGTPRYMPPEQAAGGALTPAVDQYAFCVALREALAGRHADGKPADIPGWIDAILVRGTAREPGDRFASMAELLRALARDPSTIWRRRLVLGAAVAATVAAFVVGSLRSASHAVEPCSGARQDIAETWSPSARVQLMHHLQSLGAYGGDEAARLDGELSAYAERWVTAHHAACIANQRGELTAQLYERDLGCLIRARAGLAAAVDLLGGVPGERLSNAIVAARSLPSAEGCLGETLASTVEPPPPQLAVRAAALGNEIARLRVLARAADPTVEAAAAAVAAECEQLGYLPLVARAYLVRGLDLKVRDQVVRSIPLLEHAATTALDGGDEVTFVEAYARELYAITTADQQQQPADGRAMPGAIAYVEHIARRLGPAAGFERAMLFNTIGVSRMSAGDKQDARRWFARAVDEPETRAGQVELAPAVGNLAMVVDEPEARARLFAREHDTLVSLLGPNHMMTIEATYKSAMFAVGLADATAQLADVCERVATFHAREAAGLLSRCAYDLGWLAEERGDVAAARRWFARVADQRGPVARSYLAALDGKDDEAIGAAHVAAAGLRSEWWNQLYAGDALVVAAISAERLHRPAAAIADLREALATYDRLTTIKQAPFTQRRVVRAHARLARLLAASDPAAASAQASAALAWYRTAGGNDVGQGELEALTRGKPASSGSP